MRSENLVKTNIVTIKKKYPYLLYGMSTNILTCKYLPEN